MATKDDLIHEIGTMLVQDPDISSGSWWNLVIVAQLRDLSTKVNGFAYHNSGETVPISPGNPKIPGKFRELRDAMGENWKACLVRIDDAKKITMDFEYDHPERWLIVPATVKKMADALRPTQP